MNDYKHKKREEKDGKGAKRRKKKQLRGTGSRGSLDKTKGIAIFKQSKTILKVNKQTNNPSSKEAPTHSCIHAPILERVKSQVIQKYLKNNLKALIKAEYELAVFLCLTQQPGVSSTHAIVSSRIDFVTVMPSTSIALFQIHPRQQWLCFLKTSGGRSVGFAASCFFSHGDPVKSFQLH